MNRMIIIAILFIPEFLLASCRTSLPERAVIAFDGNVIWEWVASEAVSPLQKPMSESFKIAFRNPKNANQVIYKGELHLLLVSLGNLAMIRFDDKAVVWSKETDLLIESAILTENGQVIAEDANGFEIIINTDECYEKN